MIKLKFYKSNILKNILYIFAFIFMVTRIIRNSFNYNSVQSGGIWNIIAILFLLFYLFIMCSLLNKKVKVPYPMVIAIGLSIWYFIVILYQMFVLNSIVIDITNLNQNLMSIFFVYIMSVFYFINFGLQNNKKYHFMFYAVLFISVLGLVGFRFGSIDFVMISNIYYPLCLFPLLLTSKKSIKWPLVLMLVSVLISDKRTAIIAFFIGLLVYFMTDAIMKKTVQQFFKKVLQAFTIMILLVFIVYVVTEVLDLNIIERLLNIVDDGGSGRDVMYGTVINAISQFDFSNFLFGKGFISLSILLNNTISVHNDFLHFYYCYGGVTFILFCLFYITMAKELLKMIKYRYKNAPAFAFSLVLAFIISLFSVFATDFTYIIGMAISWGYILSDWHKTLGRREQ